jgi:hypothetical protein
MVNTTVAATIIPINISGIMPVPVLPIIGINNDRHVLIVYRNIVTGTTVDKMCRMKNFCGLPEQYMMIYVVVRTV